MLYNRDMARMCANGKFVDLMEFNKLPPISTKIYRHPIISSVQIDDKHVYECRPGDAKRLNSLEQLCEALKDKPEVWLYLDLKVQGMEK